MRTREHTQHANMRTREHTQHANMRTHEHTNMLTRVRLSQPVQFFAPLCGSVLQRLDVAQFSVFGVSLFEQLLCGLELGQQHGELGGAFLSKRQ